jgi:hypothetical protein
MKKSEGNLIPPRHGVDDSYPKGQHEQRNPATTKTITVSRVKIAMDRMDAAMPNII